MPAVPPVMKTHLQRDFCRGCTVAAVKAMSEPARHQPAQALGQLHHRFMGEARQHDMLHFIELFADRRIDSLVCSGRKD